MRFCIICISSISEERREDNDREQEHPGQRLGERTESTGTGKGKGRK